MEWRSAGWLASASVNLPLHHKVEKLSSGTGSPGWSRKKGRKMVVVWFLQKNVHNNFINRKILKSDPQQSTKQWYSSKSEVNNKEFSPTFSA